MDPLPLRARCPRDGRSLSPRALGELEYLFCDGCHGLWIPHQQLEAMALRVAGGARPPRSRERLSAERIREGTARCACGRGPLMSHVQAKGVTLDLCAACGAIWLDGGELRRVVQHQLGLPRDPSWSTSGVFDGLGDLLEGLDLLELVGDLFS